MSKEQEKYADVIRKLVPINELAAQVQNEVIKKAKIAEIRKGGFVFKQGDKDEFSFYCLEGEIELLANNQQHNVIVGGTDRARYAMAQLQPRQFSARARVKSVIFQISRDTLDKLVVIQEKEQTDSAFGSAVAVEEVDFADMEGEVDWMTRILQSELFSKIPTANIHALFAMLEPVEYKAGDNVITQGEPGEHYYIIQEGSCQVSRKPATGDRDIKLAVLKAGDCFGEEALIAETTRNATVSMLTDGILMRLNKDTFIDLIKKPTLHTLSFSDASTLVKSGKAVWLDVRYKNEHEESAIPGSTNIPLNMLRLQADKLDKSKHYIVYCDTSGRSSTGAFLLTGLGFDVSFLTGGLMNNPQAVPAAAAPQPAAEPEPKPQSPPPQAEAPRARAEPAAPSKRAEKPEPVSTVDEITKQNIDPDVKSSMLEAELERTNIQLQKAVKEKQKTDDEYVRKMQEEVERRLQEERQKIETAKKEAQEEARRLRQQEETKIRKMQEEAARKLQEEKQRLEAVYTRNAEEMEKLQRMRKDAEQKLREEKEKLEKESEEARKNLDEAQRVKREVEASKRLLEKEAQKSRKEQEEIEKRIVQEAQIKLEEERRKLAEQYASNQEELEQARREKAAAEAARKAAKEEADRIIAEYKDKHDKDRAYADEKLKAERQKLEEEQRKIQETLLEINRAKEEAELARMSAVEEAKRLREKQEDKEITRRKDVEASLKVELKVAEEKISRANKELAQAQQAQVKAIAAKKQNQEGLIKQTVIEEELRKQLEVDLQGFRSDLEEEEKKFTSMAKQMDYMKRIKQSADAAKQATEQANASLLDEIASQLGKGQ
jgi:CRP-like cAMP-binding protein